MKKILSLLLLITFISVTVPNTFAATQDEIDQAVIILEETNELIEQEIADAQAEALVSDDDARIIADLLRVTERLSAKGVRDLAKLGIEAVCVYVEVLIDGVVVLVDPLEVLYW